MHTYRLKGASAKVAGQAHGLGERTVIGRAADCDLSVDDDSLAAHHAEILLDASGGLLLKRLDQGVETRLNGQPIEQASLASGDEIRLGTCRWVLQAPGLRPEKVLTGQAVKRRQSLVPWLLAIALLEAAVLAWQRGWLPF